MYEHFGFLMFQLWDQNIIAEEKKYYIALSYTAEAESMISSNVNKTVATEEKVVDGVHHQQHRSDELCYLSHSWLWR